MADSEKGLQNPMADSEKGCITDLFKGYIECEELQNIVERLHEHRFSAQTLQSMSNSEIDHLILEYFPVGLSEGAKMGFRMAIQRRKESTLGSFLKDYSTTALLFSPSSTLSDPGVCREPPSKKEKRSLVAFATRSYLEKLLEPPHKLPRGANELEDFLSRRPRPLLIRNSIIQLSICEPELVMLDAIQSLPTLVYSVSLVVIPDFSPQCFQSFHGSSSTPLMEQIEEIENSFKRMREEASVLQPFFLDEVDLLHVAKTLASHTITVDELLLLSESDKEDLIKKLFPVASVAQEYGLKAAINARKRNITHGSSSTPLMEKIEIRPKRMREEVEELTRMHEEVEELKRMREEADKLKWKSKKSFLILDIRSSDWDTLGEGRGYEWHDPQYTPKCLRDLPPFGWDDRQERTQAERYLPYLSQIRKAEKWMMIDAGNKYPTLLSGYLNDYIVRGTSDVAVILRQGKLIPECVLRCIFEFKKKDAQQSMHQILVSLVMANMSSRQFRPFAVLTDLIDDWVLCWMDESRIYVTKFESRAVAVGTLEDLLGEDQDLGHSSGLPFLPEVDSGQRDSASVLFNRRMYVPPGMENMEDLIGLIPDDEINSARVDAGLRHALQLLQRAADFGEGSGGSLTPNYVVEKCPPTPGKTQRSWEDSMSL